MEAPGDYVCQLDQAAELYCQQVLQETPEKRQACLQELSYWLEENQHLNPQTDTYNILRFLRASKFNIEVAKKKITSYYTFKSTAPEWFENRNPLLPELQSLLKTGVFLPLLSRDEEGRLVVLIRVAAHDPAIQSQNDVFKIGMMALDLALLEEDTTVYGVAAIFDMEGISLAHARALTLGMIKKAVMSWQIYPVRLRTLDFVNSPSYIHVVLNIFRSFMTQKLKDRVHVHRSRKALHSIVPRRILPEEYGGSAGTLDQLIDHWEKRVTKAESWFMETEKYRADPP